MQTRMEHCLNNLNNKSENLTAADSRLRDADMANELMQYTKFEILSSSSESMLAQANAQPAGVLNLLNSSSSNKAEKPVRKEKTENVSSSNEEK